MPKQNRRTFVSHQITSTLFQLSTKAENLCQKSNQDKGLKEVDDDDDVVELSPESIKSFREDLIQNETFQIDDEKFDLTSVFNENDVLLDGRVITNDKTSRSVLVDIDEDDFFDDPVFEDDPKASDLFVNPSVRTDQQVDPTATSLDKQLNPDKKQSDQKFRPDGTKKTKERRKKYNQQEEEELADPDPSRHFAPKTFLQSLSENIENP